MSTSSTLDTNQRRANSRSSVPPAPPPRVSSMIEMSPHRGTVPPALPPRLSSTIETSPHRGIVPPPLPPRLPSNIETSPQTGIVAPASPPRVSSLINTSPHRGTVPPPLPPRLPSNIETSPQTGIAAPAPPPRVSSLINTSPHRRASECFPQNSQTPLASRPVLPSVPLLPKLGRWSNPQAAIRKFQSCWPESSLECPQDFSSSDAFKHPQAPYNLQPTPSALDQGSEETPMSSYYIQLKPFAERPKSTSSGKLLASSKPRNPLYQSPTEIDTDSEELTIFPQHMDIPRIPMQPAPKSRGYKRPSSDIYQQPDSPEKKPRFPGFRLPISHRMYLPQPAFTHTQPDSQRHTPQAELEQDDTQQDTSASSEELDDNATGIGDYSSLSINSQFFKRFSNITSRSQSVGASIEPPTTPPTPFQSSPSLFEDSSAHDGQNLNPYAKPGPPDSYVGSSIVVGLTKSTFKDFIKDLSAAFVLFYNPCDPNCNWAKVNMKKAALVTQRDDHVFAAVDCTKECRLCKKQKVVSFPTMKLFARGKNVATFTDDTILSSRQMTDFVENAPVLPPRKPHHCVLQ
ncbi:hypothetical protein BsWGS_17029 [Bradybaena similaris]